MSQDLPPEEIARQMAMAVNSFLNEIRSAVIQDTEMDANDTEAFDKAINTLEMLGFLNRIQIDAGRPQATPPEILEMPERATRGTIAYVATAIEALGEVGLSQANPVELGCLMGMIIGSEWRRDLDAQK